MKKILTLLLVTMVVSVLGSASDAEAQPVVVSNRCCDAWGYFRCVQANYTPIGSPCFCYGQGYGRTC